jgi:hypothetical protein
MKYDKVSRRHFLQGASGSLMALPILPSLLTSEAYAQAMDTQRFFVLVGVGHGGTGYNKDWYPSAFIDNLNSTAFTKSTLLPSGGQNGIAHIVRSAKLSNLLTADPGHDGGNVDNGQQRLSYILGSFLNPYLNKLNFLAGIDGGMHYYGHSYGVYGGSLGPKGAVDKFIWPTVDQFLANSSKFYVDRNAISVPVLNMSRMSYIENGVRYPDTSGGIDGMYNALFSKYQTTTDPKILADRSRRSFLVDRVLEDFNRLIKGSTGLARRISSEDKDRLEQHTQFLFEVQKKYQSLVNTCTDVVRPTAPGFDGFYQPYYSDTRFNKNSTTPEADQLKNWDILTDLLAAAFACGATRIANLNGSTDFFLYKGDYHQEIVHQHENTRFAQLTHNKNHRWQTQHIFGSIVRKLDAINAGSGQTLLDKGVVALMHEAGTSTHSHNNLGCVLAGSSNGFFKTGNFVDFRNHDNLGLLLPYKTADDDLRRPGVPMQRLYANVVQSYGFTPAEYTRNGRKGFSGDQQEAPLYNGSVLNPQKHLPYPMEMINSFDDKLPIIT